MRTRRSGQAVEALDAAEDDDAVCVSPMTALGNRPAALRGALRIATIRRDVVRSAAWQSTHCAASRACHRRRSDRLVVHARDTAARPIDRDHHRGSARTSSLTIVTAIGQSLTTARRATSEHSLLGVDNHDRHPQNHLPRRRLGLCRAAACRRQRRARDAGARAQGPARLAPRAGRRALPHRARPSSTPWSPTRRASPSCSPGRWAGRSATGRARCAASRSGRAT